MTTKEYLNQIERLDKMITNKLSEIYQLKIMACSITVSGDSEKVQTSGNQDKLGSTIAKIVDLERETDELVDSLVDKRKEILRQIDNMKNIDHYDVLHKHYVERRTFQDIADSENWSIRQVFNIHGRALQEFEKMYGDTYLHKNS
jgi:hypothetical protein|nr:MAG TPA: Protein of unknown function (DUF1492) [Bacteriophage sp.]